MGRAEEVPRPRKKAEYKIFHASTSAQKGWRDLVANQRNVMVDAWDHLTKTPDQQSERCYPLKGHQGVVTISGVEYVRWQYKPTLKGTARIWYAIAKEASGGGIVYIENVYTHHPNLTK